MVTAAVHRKMSYEEYLAFEEASETKHEFINGEVFPLGGEVFGMAGASFIHNALVAAVSTELSLALRGRRCRVLSSDMRVRVPASQFSSYPDISVVCNGSEFAPDDPNGLLNPTIIVEVLSDSTEGYDRGAKFAHYRCIASLREYVLVSQRAPLIEVHRRNERGNWELFVVARAGQRAELVSCGAPILLDVDEIYRDPLG
jgi:Uma2 family endonuclease